MRIQKALAIAIPLLAAAACANTPELVPAPSAQPAPSEVGVGAMGTDAGVEMIARADAWRGEPATLEAEITPLLVEITNNSDRNVLIRYSSFDLASQNGEMYSAMPPFDIDEEVTERVVVEAFPYTGFTIAPYLSRYYPRLVVADPFTLDEAFYTRMVPIFRRIRLPSGDMVQQALPEGVLAPGSKVAGFIYFEDLDDDVTNVTFSADLLDATNQTQFGEINIPFVAQ